MPLLTSIWMGLGLLGIVLTVVACIAASRRGQNALVTLAICLLLTPLAGLLSVIVLPDHSGRPRKTMLPLALGVLGSGIAIAAAPFVILFIAFTAQGVR